MDIAVWGIVFVVGAIVVVAGAKKAPEIARSMGKAISYFKLGVAEGDKVVSDFKKGL